MKPSRAFEIFTTLIGVSSLLGAAGRAQAKSEHLDALDCARLGFADSRTKHFVISKST